MRLAAEIASYGRLYRAQVAEHLIAVSVATIAVALLAIGTLTGGWLNAWLYKWQTLIAGVIAGGAAIWVLRRQLDSEARREALRYDAVRLGIIAEMRTIGWQSVRLHELTAEYLKSQSSINITWMEIGILTTLADPVIYANNAKSIAAFGDYVMDVVRVYAARNAVVETGVRLAQIRNRNLSSRELLELGQRLIRTADLANDVCLRVELGVRPGENVTCFGALWDRIEQSREGWRDILEHWAKQDIRPPQTEPY